MSKPQNLSGLIHKIVFENKLERFCIAELSLEEQGFDTNKHTITLKFNQAFPRVFVGLDITATGTFRQDSKYGKQFVVSQFQTAPPKTKAGILLLLASDLFPGIGDKTAKTIFDCADVHLFEHLYDKHVVTTTYPKLKLKPKLFKTLVYEWRLYLHEQELVTYFHQHQLPLSYIPLLLEQYDINALSMLETNPYQICLDLGGAAFQVFDQFALAKGVAQNDTTRINLAIKYLLNKLEASGQSGCDRRVFEERLNQFLHLNLPELPKEGPHHFTICTSNEELIYSTELYQLECEIVSCLHALQSKLALWQQHCEPDKILEEISHLTPLTLSREQLEAIKYFISTKILILTGGPGVGKTTLVDLFVKIAKSHNIPFALAAPTGRAAQLLSDITGETAYTLHRLLEIDAYHHTFRRNKYNKLEQKIFIIDETSMIDTRLFHAFITALPLEASLVIIGDPHQLPSIQPGQILRDLLHADYLPKISLQYIFRQTQTSIIPRYAKTILEGKTPAFIKQKSDETTHYDCYFIPCDREENFWPLCQYVITQKLPTSFNISRHEDSLILTPLKKGNIGTHQLNNLWQQHFYPQRLTSPFIETYQARFYKGDKVMQTENNYDLDVFNGDIGIVSYVNTKDNSLSVKFKNVYHTLKGKQLQHLQLCYAITIHKAQGCSFPVVIVPIFPAHQFMLNRELIYTALTRAQKLCLFIGDLSTLQKCIAKQTSHQTRYTKLKDLLAASACVPHGTAGTGNREAVLTHAPGTGNREAVLTHAPGTGNREAVLTHAPGTGNREPGTRN